MSDVAFEHCLAGTVADPAKSASETIDNVAVFAGAVRARVLGTNVEH
jgi:hypothetical protein